MLVNEIKPLEGRTTLVKDFFSDPIILFLKTSDRIGPYAVNFSCEKDNEIGVSIRSISSDLQGRLQLGDVILIKWGLHALCKNALENFPMHEGEWLQLNRSLNPRFSISSDDVRVFLTAIIGDDLQQLNLPPSPSREVKYSKICRAYVGTFLSTDSTDTVRKYEIRKGSGESSVIGTLEVVRDNEKFHVDIYDTNRNQLYRYSCFFDRQPEKSNLHGLLRPFFGESIEAIPLREFGYVPIENIYSVGEACNFDILLEAISKKSEYFVQGTPKSTDDFLNPIAQETVRQWKPLGENKAYLLERIGHFPVRFLEKVYQRLLQEIQSPSDRTPFWKLFPSDKFLQRMLIEVAFSDLECVHSYELTFEQLIADVFPDAENACLFQSFLLNKVANDFPITYGREGDDVLKHLDYLVHDLFVPDLSGNLINRPLSIAIPFLPIAVRMTENMTKKSELAREIYGRWIEFSSKHDLIQNPPKQA